MHNGDSFNQVTLTDLVGRKASRIIVAEAPEAGQPYSSPSFSRHRQISALKRRR